ncbi:sugar porter family MFS transporter [Aquimarina sp. RZ0]|uniref:sugar porter family MFS transporter n=1 Tax=Aquimarina sp. RZ0 TaxID=2607730 RepID=UPI0011F1D5F4|nr:sugar porter family MFS transporter [Aquimarina sp. RZ0]KAA1242137.1 sugar porter family MFS transporter [Aquimarina sp. RZ0]
MNKHKRNAFIYAGIVALGGLIFGLDAALISGTVDYIAKEFGLNSIQIGFVVSSPGLGVLFALPVAGYISNKLGRKKALIIVAALYLVSAVTSTISPSYEALTAARFLGGLAFASLSLAAMYIGEIAPPKWRGKLVSMNQMNIVVGLSAAYFINYFIVSAISSDAEWALSMGVKENTWRWMLGSEIIPALVWFVLLFFIPKSPSWLVFKNRIEEAKSTLKKVMPENEIDPHIEQMKLSMQNTTEDNNSVLNQLKAIVSKPMRLTLIIGATSAIVQQVVGINAILFYAPTIFKQLGGGTDVAFTQAVWVGLISVVFTFLAILVIDKIGRRPMFIWGLACAILSLGICSYGFSTARYEITSQAITELNTIPNAERLQTLIGTEYKSDTEFKNKLTEVLGKEDAQEHAATLIQKSAKMKATLILIGILCFIAAFQFSIGPVMWVLFSEIFPIHLRGIAIPAFAFLTSISSYFVQLFFPWQLDNMGGGAVFLTYAILGAIGFVILYRFLPETKNMSIEEIQATLQKK